MAVNGRELNAAEVAYAAINHVEKVQFILHIKEIPTNEGRSALAPPAIRTAFSVMHEFSDSDAFSDSMRILVSCTTIPDRL